MPDLVRTNKQIIKATWEELDERARYGGLFVGDQIALEFDGKPTLHDVIGINVDAPAGGREEGRTYVTIQMHDLLEERPFDDDGCNVWEDSDIRRYLNSEEFLSRYADISGHIVKVMKENNRSEEPTRDIAFLLSIDEYDPDKTIYPYYKDKRNRVKFAPDNYTDWHMTRSALRGGAHYTWCVPSSGNVNYYYGASYAHRFAPGLCLIF